MKPTCEDFTIQLNSVEFNYNAGRMHGLKLRLANPLLPRAGCPLLNIAFNQKV